MAISVSENNVFPLRYERRFYIPEDDILQSYRLENLKSYMINRLRGTGSILYTTQFSVYFVSLVEQLFLETEMCKAIVRRSETKETKGRKMSGGGPQMFEFQEKRRAVWCSRTPSARRLADADVKLRRPDTATRTVVPF
jgi:hypothetical protein